MRWCAAWKSALPLAAWSNGWALISARTRPVMHVVAARDVMTLEEAIERVASLVGAAIDWATIESFLPGEATGGYRKSALASSFVAALSRTA